MWELVILIVKLSLAFAVAATLRFGAAPQVLAAHAVLFVELLLQALFEPYACAALDRLQTASLCALLVTCFALMAPALNGLVQPLQTGTPRKGVRA